MYSKRFLAIVGSTDVFGFWLSILTEADLNAEPKPADKLSDGGLSA